MDGSTRLLATRGKPQRRATDVAKLLVAPRREHSRKPDDTYERIERLVEGPYLELFARASRPGSTAARTASSIAVQPRSARRRSRSPSRRMCAIVGPPATA